MIRSCCWCTFGNAKINFGHTSASSGRSVRLLFGRPLYTLTIETLVDSGLRRYASMLSLTISLCTLKTRSSTLNWIIMISSRRGWTCLREFDSFRHIDNLDDLRPGAIYRGVSLNAGAL
ncbi:hypothetical protein RIF29_25149 [Crotalaria pallida]|uniref:GT-1/4-like C-terminal domain-containing protein n=1 Tax=Crotalaria pallida TaxID=3830 RepID=A0AAN9I0U2_CROPI